jgi:pyridinium-3,5-bisthiocarboxylic acid mononucleotide nickel chelatase
MSTLYIEPFSGLAGDMLLAALLDLGDPRFTLDDLRSLARSLVPGECAIDLEKAWRGNLSGQLLRVRTNESEQAPHRTYADIERLVKASPLSASARSRSLSVFMRIAVAEARVHGTTPDQIHFHEIGAVDTLVDVCGASFALERLGVDDVRSDVPVTGTGTVHCAHGEMPVPAPAVAEILRGRPLAIRGGGGERLTPTGAALLAELTASFAEPGEFVAERIGYGAGARDPKVGPPNILRVQLGRAVSRAARPHVWQMEVNLDDMTGEEIAHAAAALRAAGAIDVWTVPVLMKKSRPGVVLSALSRPDMREALERAVLDATTTLGMRWHECERTECEREMIDIEIEGQRVRVKVRRRPERLDGSRAASGDLSPEHDDVARAAEQLRLGLREVERRAIELGLRALEEE